MTKKKLKVIVTKLAEESFKDGKIVESFVVKSIKLLKSQPPSQAILSLGEYLKELKRRERQHTMYVETAVKLSSDQLKKMTKIVEKNVKITKVVTNVNPNLLGGFKLRVGDETWDESILGQITQVKEAISGRSN